MSREVQFHSPRQSGKRTVFEKAREVMEANGARKLGDYGTLGCFCPHGAGSVECCINRLGLAAKQAQEIAKLPEVIRMSGRQCGKSPMGGEEVAKVLGEIARNTCPLCRRTSGQHEPSCLEVLALSLEERKRYGV
jgi:hypothetical protein